jgi:Ca2+-binding RTX toxin-like protein
VAGQSIEVLSVFDRTTTNALNLTGNGLGQSIYGNDGVNALIGGGGTDTFYGMGGDDGIIVDDVSDVVIEGVGGGNDTVYTTANYALGAGSAVETLTVYNRFTTNAINLVGNEFGQAIHGNDGANVIDGKGGADTIFLRAGADAVRFTTALGGGNVDAVTGFVSGVDKIQLDDAIFTGLTPGALPAGVLVVGALPADGNDLLLYNQVSGQLFFDADGNGAAAAVLFATLDPGTLLGAGDFLVI